MAVNVWLVDVGFVVQAAAEGNRFKLDYLEARRFLEERLGKTEAYLFNSIDSSLGLPPGLKAFYDVVERRGFRIRVSEMTGDPAAGTHRQQGVDEALITQLETSARDRNVRTIVLTSGDAHFVPAVDEARRIHGKKIVLFGYDVNVAARLKAAVDEFWPFEAHEGALARTHRMRPGPNQRRW